MGVRLEDMNELFGDATTAMPTPVTQAERQSLVGFNSPVPSLDIHRPHGQFSADNAIPGLNIDPPTMGSSSNNKNNAQDDQSRHEGLGGWISNMLNRGKDSSKSSQYRRLDQDEEG